MKKLFKFPLEATVWTAGLIALAFTAPEVGNHVTICPIALTGLEWCPGCGLGRSVSFLFRGEFSTSFKTHPLGFFAVIVLSFRIFQLTKIYLKQHYGPRN